MKGPKALCELQGYVYDAWLRMAEVFDALGKPEPRSELRDQGRRSVRRGSTRFSGTKTSASTPTPWMAISRKVLTVASNAGHCLWSGIVPPERAQKGG